MAQPSWCPLVYALNKAAKERCAQRLTEAQHAVGSRGAANLVKTSPDACSFFLTLPAQGRCKEEPLLAYCNQAIFVDALPFLDRVVEDQHLVNPHQYRCAVPESVFAAVERVQANRPLKNFEVEVERDLPGNGLVQLLTWAGANVWRVDSVEDPALEGARGRSSDDGDILGRKALLSRLARQGPATPATLPAAIAPAPGVDASHDDEHASQDVEALPGNAMVSTAPPVGPAACEDGAAMDVDAPAAVIHESLRALMVCHPWATMPVSDALHAFGVAEGVLALDTVRCRAQALARTSPALAAPSSRLLTGTRPRVFAANERSGAAFHRVAQGHGHGRARSGRGHS